MTTEKIIKEFKELNKTIEEFNTCIRMLNTLESTKKIEKMKSYFYQNIEAKQNRYNKIDSWLDAMEEGNGYFFK